MYVRDEGQGEATVLLHGLGASSRVFDPLFAARTTGRLLAIDLPRSGRSGHYARSTPAAIAEALGLQLANRHLSRFHLFGHSFGGLVALELAALSPERVTRLSVASAPAFGLPAQFSALLEHPLAEWSTNAFSRLPVFRPALQAYLGMIRGTRTPPSRELLRVYEEASSADGFGQGMLEALRAIARFRVDVKALATLPVPKLVLWGEKDPLVSVIQGERLANAIGATLTVLHDVGHCVPEEAPGAVLAAIG
jgi:pimeloyl-ACP methyl ester carboxylesterase